MTGYQFLIGVDDLDSQLLQPALRVVDCRFDLMQPAKGFEEYRQAHIPGARYANLDEDLAGPVTVSSGRHPLPSPETFAKTLGAWGIDNTSQVVVYDHGSGAIAARLWWMLRWVGHRDVAVLDGGFAAWIDAGRELTDRVEWTAVVVFRPAPDSNLVISIEELLNSTPLIVDARDPERFAGRREPIDSVAGHIPGAVNHPFSEAIGEDDRWKRPDELRAGWARIFGGVGDPSWVCMCGSGVTACHLALSAGLAGYPQPRLYVGSWSEWIRDPRRPVANAADLR